MLKPLEMAQNTHSLSVILVNTNIHSFYVFHSIAKINVHQQTNLVIFVIQSESMRSVIIYSYLSDSVALMFLSFTQSVILPVISVI